MDTFAWLFFESSIALGIVLGLVLFGLLVHWRRTLQPRPLLIGLVVALGLLVVQKLVITHREHAGAIMTQIERDIVNTRTGALARLLAADFVAGERDRDVFLAFVRAQMNLIRVHSVRRGSIRITARDAGTFTAVIGYSAMITTGGFVQQLLPTTWRIWFVREADGWKIQRILPVRIGGQEIPTWEQFERL